MKKDLEFLAKLQKELKEGEHDYQAFPRYWAIKDYTVVQCEEEKSTLRYIDCGDYEILPFAEAVETFQGLIDAEEIEEGAGDTFDEGKMNHESLVKWIRDHYYEEARLVPMMEIGYIVPNTLFLTKAEAKEHLRRFGYNYGKDAHTYAMTALRAPKTEKVFEILESFDFEKLLSVIEE